MENPGKDKNWIQNLQNLVSLGVDHIDYQVNPEVEKKFMYKALVKYGSTALPMHMALFNIPLKIAFKFDIPLVIWGENSAFEYGTDDEELKGIILDSKWLEKFGLTYGTTADDWIDQDLTKKELTPYFGPTDQELEDKGIRAIFMGYYFKWDPENTLNIAQKKGFKPDENGPRTGLYNYADIDDEFI
ncbi:MAG: N-acetyl sugar amidotransferase, partial [Bacteroidia bacterium]|nr:N-acetyl sugar amidotransferase [Bacteroidia bacterium]